MNIKLNKDSFDLLTRLVLKDRISMQETVINSITHRDKDTVIIRIEKEIADEIRDLAGIKLQEVGFDENYNLTSTGEILESLIDILFVEGE